MKKFIGVLGCLLVAATSVQANAEVNIPAPTPNWHFLGSTPQGEGYSIQVMQRQGQNVGYWQRITYANPQPGGYTIQGVYGIGNCQQSTISILWIVRATKGKLIGQGGSDNTKPMPMPVNSIGNTGLRVACGGSAVGDSQAKIVKAQIEALERARETNARMIIETMKATAEMFK